MTCEGCGSKILCILNSKLLPPIIGSLDKCRDECPCQDCLIKSICEVFCDDRKNLLNTSTKFKSPENIITELVRNGIAKGKL
jgi:hypothetical protein